ncbi:hypothetical protein GF373_02320 [bacterium]|nr:hypothetical protein [bacterium]
MKKRFHLIHGIPLSLSLFSLLLYFFIVSLFAGPVHANSDDLAVGFDNPPHAARPHAYWAWMNGYVSIPQLTKELENMKEKGLAGLEIFDIGAKDPENIVPAGPAFMGAESVQAIAHAVREAGRLGMEIGLITSSSWNAGGPWVKPKHGTQGIFHSQAVIDGPDQITLTLPVPKIPKIAPKNENGLPAFYKDVAVLAIPFSEAKQIEDLGHILDISECMDPSGQLNWKAPKGKWTLMRFICACTGETLVLPSPKSDGLIIDHFSAEATTMHFQYLIAQLKTELGDLSKTALRYLYLPSYEVTSYDKEKGMVWTPALVKEFTQRRGYDPTTYLPLLFGYTSSQKEIANRFHYDFRMTLSDLIIENHYQTAREVCHEHGLLLCSEAGGPGQPLHNCPFEALRALGSLDVPRGEFWYKHQRFDEEGIDILWLVKEIACAAHIYNKTVVDGEAFTSFHHWQLSPLI